MAIETPEAGTTEEATEPTPINRPRGHTYNVEAGEVRDWRPSAEAQSAISTTELNFKNGVGMIGDPVTFEGRRGTAVQFLFRPAREGKTKKIPGGWDVVVKFDVGEPKEERLNPLDVELILSEIKRAPKPPSDQETTSYGVPTDASFGDEEVKEAGDLRQMATAHIQETEDFPKLKPMVGAPLAFFWAKKGGSAGQQPVIYRVRWSTKQERKANGWRIVVTFSADVIRDLLLKREVVNALVHECLCSVDRAKNGNLVKLAPDFKGYTRNVERYGDLIPHVHVAAEALSVAAEDVRNLRLDLEDAEVETGV